MLALGAGLVTAAEAAASVFEYLHVEANAGSSAGGDFALRLDNWVYDFQNAELGTLRLRRTDYDLFRYLYTVSRTARCTSRESTFRAKHAKRSSTVSIGAT